MVDTGASFIALSEAMAEAAGLDYKNAQRVTMNTANGQAQGWAMKLAQVRVGDVTIYNVDAVITPAPMPAALLGNSFLNHFAMQRNGSPLTIRMNEYNIPMIHQDGQLLLPLHTAFALLLDVSARGGLITCVSPNGIFIGGASMFGDLRQGALSELGELYWPAPVAGQRASRQCARCRCTGARFRA